MSLRDVIAEQIRTKTMDDDGWADLPEAVRAVWRGPIDTFLERVFASENRAALLEALLEEEVLLKWRTQWGYLVDVPLYRFDLGKGGE